MRRESFSGFGQMIQFYSIANEYQLFTYPKFKKGLKYNKITNAKHQTKTVHEGVKISSILNCPDTRFSDVNTS